MYLCCVFAIVPTVCLSICLQFSDLKTQPFRNTAFSEFKLVDRQNLFDTVSGGELDWPHSLFLSSVSRPMRIIIIIITIIIIIVIIVIIIIIITIIIIIIIIIIIVHHQHCRQHHCHQESLGIHESRNPLSSATVIDAKVTKLSRRYVFRGERRRRRRVTLFFHSFMTASFSQGINLDRDLEFLWSFLLRRKSTSSQAWTSSTT